MKNLRLLLLLAVCGCQSFREHPPGTADTVAYVIDTALLSRETLMSRASVRAFYGEENLSLPWIQNGALSPAGDSLLAFISASRFVGLIADDYHHRKLHSLLSDSVQKDRLKRIDVLLTDAYLTLFDHIQNGRLDPLTLSRRDISKVRDNEAIASLRRSGIRSPIKALLDVEPDIGAYRDLKRILDGFERNRSSDSVQRKRALAVALNMERWRWDKRHHDRYVTVNIPAYVLRVFEKDSLWFETKVIVGKRQTPTPVMQSVIRSFIIYPYWHVPYSIATREILPALQKNSNYLKKNNFDVLDKGGKVIWPDTIQWDFYTPENFPFVLRQREGSENSMGIIKFIFNNSYGVYLHDTNSKQLYKRQRRDLSHGCIRVSDAVGFAHYLVHEDDIYVSPEDLDQYLSLQQRHTIDLRKPITLRLDYFTVEVKNDKPFFYEDIYRRDSMMLRSLYAPLENSESETRSLLF